MIILFSNIIDALFRFNPQAFSFQEDVGLAEIGIQLIENSLSFPITISVVDIFDAAITTGENTPILMHALYINIFFYTCMHAWQ